MQGIRGVLAAAAAMTLTGCVSESQAAQDEALVGRIAEATVLLVPPRCAGVLVGDASWVLTAAHCVGRPGTQQQVELSDGNEADGTLVVVDRDNDLALIRLDEAPALAPLDLATELPAEGDPIFFVGRSDRPIPAQLVSIERLAPCPSLPSVPRALHTGLRGEPGDSGAPVVDLDLRVVGLVHGGAACSIAAPVAPMSPVLEQLSR